MSTISTPIWELPDEEQPIEGLDEHGEPDPAYAAALGLVAAPLGRRAAAAALDIAVFVLLQVTFWILALPLLLRLLTGRISWYGFVNHPDFLVAVIVTAVTVLLTIVFVVAQLAVQARWGLTLGKLATGLRVVNVKTLGRPGFWRVAGRGFEVWVPAVTVVGLVLFLASPYFAGRDDRGRGWHDRLGRTWVVDVRAGLNPYDEKRMRIARKLVTSAPAARAKPLPSLATEAEGADVQRYRPGSRTSAGVLGVARPHRKEGRVVVGLAGLEAGPVPDGANDTRDFGSPRLGAYLNPAGHPSSDQEPVPAAPAAPAAPHPTPSEPVVPRPGPRHLAAGERAAAPDVTPPGTSVTPGVSLAFDTGDQISLTSAIVVGRSPQPVGDARPMPIADPSSSLSKTHVVLSPGVSGLEVIDQGSTNGTTLVHEGVERRLAPGEIGLAEPGDTIRFGDRSARVQGS